MGVMDSLRSKMANDGRDDEEFDDEEFGDEDFEDDETGGIGFFGSLFGRKNKQADEEDEEEEDELPGKASESAAAKNPAPRFFASADTRKPEVKPDSYRSYSQPLKEKESPLKGGARVIPMNKTVGSSAALKQAAEVYLLKPKTEEDARTAVDILLEGKILVINLEGLNIEVAQYVTDFVTGASYSIGGNFETINSQVFVFTPPNISLGGDFDTTRSTLIKGF